MIRDVEVASAILPIVTKHHLAQPAVEHLLMDLDVPRAGNVARLVAGYGVPVA
jgi:hypothetical protein